MAENDFVFTRKWQYRVKLFTYVSCGAALVGCLTADWDRMYGDNHVFSGIRPGLKRFFNDVFGVSGTPATLSSSTDKDVVAAPLQQSGQR